MTEEESKSQNSSYMISFPCQNEEKPEKYTGVKKKSEKST